MTLSIFSDDANEDDDGMGHPGGFLRATPTYAFGRSSRQETPMSEEEELRREAETVRKKIEAKEKEDTETLHRAEDLKRQLDTFRKKKEVFLQSFGAVFPGSAPSLGNFETEIASFERQIEACAKRRGDIREEMGTLSSELHEKEILLEKKCAEEAEKNAVAARPDIDTKKKEKEDVSKGVKEYWETLSWEEKKRIFVLRDTVVSAMEEGTFLREKMQDFLTQECASEGVIAFECAKKMESAVDMKKEILLAIVCASRAKKLDELESIVQKG